MKTLPAVMNSGKAWQPIGKTIGERCAFALTNELLSDVKFVAGERESTTDNERRVIAAHKFVLSISSPVFLAMFYGEMAETSEVIQLPDTDYDSLLEFFRFLYSDEVKLTGDNVMQLLYLANKYMVPSLADRCTEYIQNNLDQTNVLCVLSNAQKFEEETLVQRCWEFIDKKTEDIVKADEFFELDRCVVESIVNRDGLCIKEVELFKAVDRWVSVESERQGFHQNSGGNIKRKILGETIVKSIRFPLMSQKDFMSHVPDSNILTSDEIIDLMKHFNGVPLQNPLPFLQTPRKRTIRDSQKTRRLGTYIPPAVNWFSHTRCKPPESTRC
ncbi:BTB/POZ domain-containing protein 2-like [Acropora millepora]|uniref:BTB/POZ domain-containing protein 2-like n=1 Tax=Acropora millepora TaxID=45264 RepID=UPI001CF20DA3|nr:BTB/POZ domain-containing protein 2-like [Acropora millepora]